MDINADIKDVVINFPDMEGNTFTGYMRYKINYILDDK